MSEPKATTSHHDIFSLGKIEVGKIRQGERKALITLDPAEGIKMMTSADEEMLEIDYPAATISVLERHKNGWDRIKTAQLGTASGAHLTLRDNENKTAVSLTALDRSLRLYDSTGRITVHLDGKQGNIHATGTVYATCADLAENFACTQEYEPAADEQDWDKVTDPIEPGDVLVISDDGTLAKCSEEYDPRVAGVVSGADGDPAIVLNEAELPGTEELYPGKGVFAVALAGKVYCKVSGDIRAGDLLTTSKHKGRAMTADPTDPSSLVGRILGKALRDSSGHNQIPILVMLG